MEDSTKKEMAKLLLAYSGTFLVQVVAQKICFFRAIAIHKKKKENYLLKDGAAGQESPRFDKTTDPLTYAGDRCVGNYLEWTPLFLTMVGLNALMADGEGLWSGWIVVTARCVYPILAVYGNAISRKGTKKVIFLATAPMYITYWYLGSQVYAKL